MVLFWSVFGFVMRILSLLVFVGILYVVLRLVLWFLGLFAWVLPERGKYRESFGGSYTTVRGERVRSLGEKRIADFLFERGVQYEYEPLMMVGGEKVRPDFALPEYEFVVEFYGVEGDEGYDLQSNYKRSLYKSHQSRVIELYPQDLENLEEKLLFRLRPPFKVVGEKKNG